jgi:hypothetical protein
MNRAEMLARLMTKLRRDEPSRADLTISRASLRAMSILYNPITI